MPPPRRDDLVDRTLGVWNSKCNLCKKLAFTLAEVLITLGIIGVVAALTMPNLIENHKKKETVVKLKKIYSEISQAVLMSELDNGDKADWEYDPLTGYEFFNLYLRPYMNIMSTQTVQDAQNLGIVYYRLSGDVEINFKTLKSDAYFVNLASGYQIFSSNDYSTSSTKTLIIDINGFKRPNTIGKDIFAIIINSKIGVQPYKYQDYDPLETVYTRDELLNYSGNNNYKCSKSGRGFWCLAVIINDGWQIKKDYPW